MKAPDTSPLSRYFVALVLFVGACAPTRPAVAPLEEPVRTSVSPHETLNATAWMQLSAEYRAAALQAYRTAADRLRDALSDTAWSALPGQSAAGSLAPAVILDVDETVLDNSPYQARLIADDTVYSRSGWNAWVREEAARAIPGAVDFTRLAHEAGAVVFYVTNRSSDLEEATTENLRALGFPVAETIDAVLTRGEREEWTSDKETRRAYVAARYRVLLLVGDDLNDFETAEGLSVAEREALVDESSDLWGERWIVLPNPVYGSWERVLTQGEGDGSRSAQIEAKARALRSR